MDEDERRECPMCASRNVSFNERDQSLACRDCGNVVAGTPVRIELPREEAVEVVHEKREKVILKKPAKKAKKVVKKVKKKVKKKIIKKKAKKVVKKKAAKKKKGILGRLLKRR